jgi:HK97 family phage prohead protease
MDTLERRYTPVAVELRVSHDHRTIGGYAIVFEKLSKNLGGFVERVAPSAVNRQRGNDWSPGVVARYMHDDNMLLGTTGSGTLRLSVDNTGLAYDVTPPQARADVVELVERGDVRGSSFAFRASAVEDEWDLTDQGYPRRTLVSVQLTDVAPVISYAAAYPDATAGLRSLSLRFQCDLEEVRTLAEADELRKFFVRTDTNGRPQKPKTLGAAARMELLGKEKDPWT